MTRARRVLAGLLWLALIAGPQAPAGAKDEPKVKKLRVKAWLDNGPPEERVDVVFVGDGYQRRHLTRSGKYWRDVNRYARELFEEMPFTAYKKLFNVHAVFLESKDAGIGGDTALKCRFKGDRLLSFGDAKALEAALSAAPPADIAFVMVNTERRGGAGSRLGSRRVRGRALPAPTFSAQDTISFQIAVHELGHSFGGLADEYVDLPLVKSWKLPKPGQDLRQANVTVAEKIDVTNWETIRQTAKWAHFMDMRGAKRWAWAYEGGYYRDRGVFRPFPRCRMRKSGDAFCPVCCEQVAKAIHEAAGQPWDAAAYHKKHPLRLWR